jgi:hypothetical protein
MGWYDPKDIPGAKNDEAAAAAEAAEAATADAKFRTDLITVLREIRDTLRPPATGQEPPEEPGPSAPQP